VKSFLQEIFFSSAELFGTRIALEESSGKCISYQDLKNLIHTKVAQLATNKIEKGNRVAIMAPKSIETIATMLAILDCGATYVPIDIETPLPRLQQILTNLNPHAFIAEESLFPKTLINPKKLATTTGNTLSITFLNPVTKSDFTDLAFILYTSGSTGIPKGVCISHENAIAFINWSLETFSLSENDRFSSIAPLHFDLSVFDIYTAFACGGTIVLIDEATTKNPRLLGEILIEKNITVTYATPSLLSLLINFGKIETLNFSKLRLALFAGEIFPIQHLHRLMKVWANTQFFNLYGPTETNVCSWFVIPRPIDEKRKLPYPIGQICSQLESQISKEGELLISGANVTAGYWEREDLNSTIFEVLNGKVYYNTGDRVELDTNGDLVYLGRFDRMIKKRGYRIESEEVEQTLMNNKNIIEAAIIESKDSDGYSFIKAFIVTRPNTAVTVLEIKEHCQKLLPPYMIPEQIIFLNALPKTSSGKVDFKKLAAEG